MTQTLDSFMKIQPSRGKPGEWLGRLQKSSEARWCETGFPSRKAEDWRYTSVSALQKHEFAVVREISGPELSQDPRISKLRERPGRKIFFVNGNFIPDLSDLKGFPAGVTICPLGDVARESHTLVGEIFERAVTQNDSFTALNQAVLQNGCFIHVAANVTVEEPLYIYLVTDPFSCALPVAAHPRLIVVLEKNAEAQIVENYLSFGTELHFTNAASDLMLGPNARMRLVKINEENFTSYHIGTTRVTQAQASQFDSFNLNVGSSIARHNIETRVQGEGCTTSLNGLYLLNGDQHVDHRTLTEHQFPNCESQQHYKGILDDRARAVFNGRVRIEQKAQKTNARQLNNNLLLSSSAEVDSKPQLEIDADDVKATHGATVGQLSKEEIFYIRSRAIDLQTAMQMALTGFVEEVLEKITSPSISAYVRAVAEKRFQQMKMKVD